jgi:hypothetical protein
MSETPNKSQLTPEQCVSYSVPSGSQWFFRQTPARAALTANGFMTAWDTSSGAKLFAAYPSAPDFYKHFLKQPLDKRWGYEIIPESAPCKAYMNIEWLSPIDQGSDNHSRILLIIEDIRNRFEEKYSRAPEIYVCCGSRVVWGQKTAFYKNSYHVVIANFVFENNWDGQMRSFFMCNPTTTTSMLDSESNAHWYYPDPNPIRHGKPKSVLDHHVYLKNHQFRLPLASMLGSDVPLTRISGNPFDVEDDFMSKTYSEEDLDNLLPMVLTHPPEESDFFFVPARIILEDSELQSELKSQKKGEEK